MVSEYERQRAENIARNKKMLEAMGLHKAVFVREPKEVKQAPRGSRKRKTEQSPEDSDDSTPPAKVSRKEENELDASVASEESGSVRRSSRNRGKTVNYNSDNFGTKENSLPLSIKTGVRGTANDPNKYREGGGMKRVNDPRTYGHIPGVEVGSWWETRQACSEDAIHAPWVGGISSGPKGAYSVALSGGYEDDVDLGYGFTFTGSGGRDLKGTKDKPKNLRSAPQSCAQSFENSFNKALKLSSETRKPVRVIRGFKGHSKYAPSEGYRYDGLYIVEKAWMEDGLEGFAVCKYAFKRLPDQPALPVREGAEDEED